MKLNNWFAGNYLSTGAGVVTMFIIQVKNVPDGSVLDPLNQTLRHVGLIKITM